MVETYKTVSGYETYEVSDAGNVRNSSTGRLLNPRDRSVACYKSVILYKDTKPKTFNIHRLVAQEFIGDINGKIVMHLDDNPSNNKLSNLKIGTHAENSADRDSKGRGIKGEMVGISVLTDGKVFLIRKLYETGFFRYKDLAKRFGTSMSCIECVIRKKTWKHI